MNIIDMHCDTLYECYFKGYELGCNPCSVDLKKLSDGNSIAQFFAIFIPTHKEAEEKGISTNPYQLFNLIYNYYTKELEKNSKIIRPVLSYSDLCNNINENLLSSILTIEEGEVLDNKISMVEKLYNKGVRLMTLMWNYENCIGYPNSRDKYIHRKGLKPFGYDVISEMNRLGLIIDVSHMSEGGFYDVARCSGKPFVASHSCARSLCDHPRNLTDEQLKCLGTNGGIVGVNYCSSFLNKNSNYTYVSDILRHIDYIINVGGIDSVALGSDFDGINNSVEINDFSQYGILIKALEEKYSYTEIEKICNKNVTRIIKDNLE